jgi:hypothetical protein
MGVAVLDGGEDAGDFGHGLAYKQGPTPTIIAAQCRSRPLPGAKLGALPEPPPNRAPQEVAFIERADPAPSGGQSFARARSLAATVSRHSRAVSNRRSFLRTAPLGSFSHRLCPRPPSPIVGPRLPQSLQSTTIQTAPRWARCGVGLIAVGRT